MYHVHTTRYVSTLQTTLGQCKWYVDIHFSRCIVYNFSMRFHSRRISFDFIRKAIVDARRSKIGRFHAAFKSFAASYPLGKSAAAGAACFCRDFTYVVVAIGALAHLENPNTRRAQRHGVNADINVTVFVLARHSRPYIIFGTDSKC